MVAPTIKTYNRTQQTITKAKRNEKPNHPVAMGGNVSEEDELAGYQFHVRVVRNSGSTEMQERQHTVLRHFPSFRVR